MDERVLAERLITYDTSTVEGLRAAAGFIKGWLEAREIAVADHQYGDVFALTAEVGASEGPTLVFHGHYDVVPAGDKLVRQPFEQRWMRWALAAYTEVVNCARQTFAEVMLPDAVDEHPREKRPGALIHVGHPIGQSAALV